MTSRLEGSRRGAVVWSVEGVFLWVLRITSSRETTGSGMGIRRICVEENKSLGLLNSLKCLILFLTQMSSITKVNYFTIN